VSKIIPLVRVDTGTAYGRPTPSHLKNMTEVGPGTPMGELLRRYWHPIGLSSDANATPKKVRVLGEDLILFRNLSGQPGLLYPHCMHRGTSLFYGKVDDTGIRCCYHGWKFDTTGHCLDQPCEPDGGRFKDKVRQPWYPLQEHYGLIWAYMGPPDKKPVLPTYECLDQLDEDEFLEADDSSIGGGGPRVIPCNWMQHYENLVDPFHVVILHASFSGTQFVEEMAVMPEVNWENTELGVRTISMRQLPDGRAFKRISEAGLPTLRVIPSPKIGRMGRVESIGWILPIDDHSFRIFVVGRVREKGELSRMRTRMNGKLWEEMSEEEHQIYPNDVEAMVSQGVIAHHSDEHLATSDRGIVMLRRMLLKQLDIVAAGGDPAGVHFDAKAPAVHFTSGNFMLD
jgi:phenylpropionate dioxygenase-like ring-hydroxylating dioxygenase large terminal subunit